MRADRQPGSAVAMTTAIIIPTRNGAGHLRRLLPALRGQRPAPAQIVVIDSDSTDDSAAIAREHGCIVEVIPQREFNHGATRNRAAALADPATRVLVFMTQDALPTDAAFLAELVAPVAAGEVAAAYARQLPYPQATPPEIFARTRNYPAQAHRRSAADVGDLGIRAYFFSNVASAIDRAVFTRLGGFPVGLIMNEDMLFCARLLAAGGSVAYQASAQVFHSHDYSIAQQFRRYFDIGCFMSDHAGEMPAARSAGAGLRFALGQLGWLIRQGHLWWALRCPFETLAKLVAFRLGRWHHRLPLSLKLRCSMHAFHWTVREP